MSKMVLPTAVGSTGTRIRAFDGDKPVIDSRDVLLLRESPFKIYYGVPEATLPPELLQAADKEPKTTDFGRREYRDVAAPSGTRKAGAFLHRNIPDDYSMLDGYAFFRMDSFDRWMEEDEELLGHARDPFTRIDVRQSSARVQVLVDGVEIADSNRPKLLMETGLPVRYYLPPEDVKMEHLVESDTATTCPYKGRSRYWSIQAKGQTHQDLAWAYTEPLQDAERVKDHICFYQEKLTVLVNEEIQEKPPKYFTK